MSAAADSPLPSSPATTTASIAGAVDSIAPPPDSAHSDPPPPPSESSSAPGDPSPSSDENPRIPISWPPDGAISLDWVSNLMAAFDWSSRHLSPSEFPSVLPVPAFDKLVLCASKILHKEPNCVRIDGSGPDSSVVVVGDVHGQLHDVLFLLRDAGLPSENRFYVFNGDYVDRGAWGLETFVLLLAWKIQLEHLGKDANSVHIGINLDSGLGVFDAFFASLSMILVSEIGDETFIIAALMAMRHPKSIVLSGALSALFVMTILSTGLGRIVPNLISRKHTNSAATVLYLFFGLRLLYIAWTSDSKASQKKEMEEVEEKLEGGQGKTSIRRFFSRFCTPIFLESFILTFLAEWGDRSQIATIALATHKNTLGVAVGATIGHTICTSVAVVGGSMLASRISQRTVATVGGLLFLGFSVSSYFYPPM